MKKNWYAVITADVLYDETLSARQKILVAVISNLSNEKGYCFASNGYLAKICNTSTRSIQRDLQVLEEKYIGRVVKLKSDGKVEFRALTPTTKMTPPHDTDDTPPRDSGVTPPHDTGVTYNNKEDNNKLLNNKNNIQFIPFDQFWSLYNKKTGKITCRTKWSKLTAQEQNAIMEHLPKYVNATPNTKYRKNPLTYLNNRTWEDEELPNQDPEDYIQKNKAFAKSALKHGLN